MNTITTIGCKTVCYLVAVVFVPAAGLSAEVAGQTAPSAPKTPKPPFRVLFSNDFTNMETCVSPYHKKGQRWTPEMLEATVDETANTGVEVHMLQPCVTWVPWWKSEVYSMQEHYDFWFGKYGNYPTMPVHEYIIKGGDPFEVFINRCREKGLTPFISVRLNDGHHLENVDIPNNKRGGHCICKFYAEHPEYRIGTNLKSWDQRVHNWAIPAVRNYKYQLIEEICQNYDLEGLELDFMRHGSYFQVDKTTGKQRADIITGFVGKVRRLLDRTAKPGQHRWLSVRIPCILSPHERLGIDVARIAAAGVDIINASPTYYTVQQHDLAKIVKMAPGTAVYLEMCHTTTQGKRVAQGYDSSTYRRTTDEQYYTAAHLAYARGAVGVTAFNFVYYREHGQGERGPFNEPPFHIFKGVGDPQWVARQPQHYILAKSYSVPNMPKDFTPKTTVKYPLDMAPPAGGWTADATLRIQSDNLMNNSKWVASFNGVGLKAAEDLAEPYPSPYTPLLGTKEIMRGWTIPNGLLRDGINQLELTMQAGSHVNVVYLDIAVK